MTEKSKLVVSFSEGEDVFDEIVNLMQEKGETYFEFLSASGNIKDFVLLSTGQNASLNSLAFPEAFSFVSISGKIEKQKGKFLPTVYASLSKNGTGLISGQLVKAVAVNGLELTLRKVNVKKIILG